ncbi:MAG: HIT family protein [Caldisericia bacterium]
MNFCPFCVKDRERIIFESKLSFALLDIYPITYGHTLIIPKRHILKIEDLTKDEVLDIFEVFNKVKNALEKFLKPDGFNFGINIGEASGQSIEHIHFHLIPRYKGDTQFPDGGIRKVIMNFIDFEKEDFKSKWIKNRLNKEEIEKIREFLKK